MFKWVKVNAIQRGVLLKEVASKAGFTYCGFNQIINGFRTPPKGFNEKVQNVFNLIDSEIPEKEIKDEDKHGA